MSTVLGGLPINDEAGVRGAGLSEDHGPDRQDATEDAPGASLGFTALTTFGPLATKRFRRDGLTGDVIAEPYGNAKYFRMREVTFNDIDDLYAKLKVLLGESKTLIVRGKPLDGISRDKARRLLGPEGDDPATIGPCSRAFAMLDMDWNAAPVGIDPVTDPGGAINFILRQLPRDLDDVDVILQWGSSQGVKPQKLSAHIFALLDRAIPDVELKRWALHHKRGDTVDPPCAWLDVSLFHPVQPNYTAGPIFVGIDDPLAGRRLVLVRRSRRVATLVIPPPPQPRSAGEWAQGLGECLGYEEHRAKIGSELGFHAPLVSAVGAYVREHGPRGTDVEALIADLAAAVRQADPGGRTDDEIGRYASDKFLRGLITSIMRKDAAPSADVPPSTGPYDVQHGRIVFKKTTSDGRVETVGLTNFTARIVEDLTVDDGAETHLDYRIEGALWTGAPLPIISVPASQFPAMSWPSTKWGSDAVITAGRDGKDRVREAIQRLSLEQKSRRTVFQHTGWRKLDGKWVYLHAGGALGEHGQRSDVEVQLQGGLVNVSLPTPPNDIVEVFREILDALPGDDRIKLVMLAVMACAVMGEILSITFAIFIVGPTGVFKTEIAALLQKFCGAGFSAQALPGNFSSTANALERLCFTGKDSIVVLDEFTPKGVGTREAAELHAKGERIFRAIGNVAARDRMTPDGQLRRGYTPRGLVVATGEDLPQGQSLQARMFVLEVGAGDITPEALTRAQIAADRFSELTAGFVQWLAPQIDNLKATARRQVRDLRGRAVASGSHARTPDTMAALACAFDILDTFLVEKGLPVVEGEGLRNRMWAALTGASSAQAEVLKDADPIGRFHRLLQALFASGRAHVLDAATGGKPVNSVSWGWTDRTVANAFGAAETSWHPVGSRLGYLRADTGDLLLEWDAAYAALQHLARDQGENLALSSRMLLKRLDAAGCLVREPNSPVRTVRFTPPGGVQRRYVQVLTQREKVSEVSEVSEVTSAGGEQESAPARPVAACGEPAVVSPLVHQGAPPVHRGGLSAGARRVMASLDAEDDDACGAATASTPTPPSAASSIAHSSAIVTSDFLQSMQEWLRQRQQHARREARQPRRPPERPGSPKPSPPIDRIDGDLQDEERAARALRRERDWFDDYADDRSAEREAERRGEMEDEVRRYELRREEERREEERREERREEERCEEERCETAV